MINRDLNIKSNDNTLFVTSQCNNRCLMCSQPPLKRDDTNYYFEKNLNTLKSAPAGLKEIGITGGEPTLIGNRLFSLINEIFSVLPDVHIHLLSNGRAFSDRKYARMLADAGKSKILVGIPLHSDYVHDHDLIAGSANAYNETLKGLYFLGEFDVKIELRIVINKLNYSRLPQMSTFIYRNLPFVKYISFMGMEDTGYAIKNHRKIWVEPEEYMNQLEMAIINLATWGMDVSIFNIPLCCLPDTLHEFARQSISDWKVRYLAECGYCSLMSDCCGLFSTSKKVLKVKPFMEIPHY